MTAAVTCPVCTSMDAREVLQVETTARYTARRCRSCGLVSTWPRPTVDELAEVYSAAYFEGGGGALGYRDYRELGELNAIRSWSDLKRFTSLDGLQPRHVLDAGCATGGFLSQAQRDGWRCTGVEMSTTAAAAARAGHGLDVLEGDLFNPSLPMGAFGLVTMWHVLEHVVDPAATLARARELLSPRGVLFLEMPNWDSLGRIVRRERWSQMKPPEHINFFTPRSLSDAVRRAGLTPSRVDTHYPSLADRAQVPRPTRPLHVAAALAGRAVSLAGRGGYLRMLARR